ncbi:MAG TPA: type II toxin-antitoxin system YafQ family toxin [Bryobacteraceae bacterium]|nr:type II toxin-antitoxin system YafQ family toxin [Bryobacteraceae bacterium]
MRLALLTTTRFEKDMKRVRKQGKDLDKLEGIVDLLQTQHPLPLSCHVHRLRGTWSDHWDCHIEPNWLLLYRVTETSLILVRTGSHAELFE